MTGDSVTFLAAFGGGVVSFLSPCVLPIVPPSRSVITGLDITKTKGGTSRQMVRVARDTGLFIGGFSAVFVLLGLSATTIGRTVSRNQLVPPRISGLLVLTMALFLIGSLILRAPWLYPERRFHPDLSRFGPFAAPLAGVAFGFGWTPCIGPVLSSVLAVAATRSDPGRGAALLAFYSAGLGIPFLVTGLAFARVSGAFAWVKRHFTAITMASAASLAFFGILLTFNRLVWITSRLQQALDAIGLDSLVTLG